VTAAPALRLHDRAWETNGPEAVRALQLARLKAVLEKTWACNEFYREHWRSARLDVAAVDSLEAFSALVPTVEKKDFIADQEAHPPFGRRHRHALAAGKRLEVFMTSGTTGQGQELHAHTEDERRLTAQVYAHMFRWAGMEPGEQVLLTMPLTMMAGGRLEAFGAESYGLTVFPAGSYDAGRKLELLARFRPRAVLGTTSYFGHLAALAPARPPAPGVKVLFAGGEGAGLSWYLRVAEEWQASIFDRYGSTQSRNDHMFSCEQGVGSSARPGMLHNIDPWVLLEVVDPATGRHVGDGEQGEIVLTSLYHLDVPLVRCRMRDTAVFHEGRYCACGRPYRGVEVGSIGRSDDMKKVKGVNVWPQAVEDVLFAIPEIDEYVVSLSTGPTGADVASVQVMPARAAAVGDAPAFADRVAARLRRRVGIRFDVVVVAPGTLARSEYKARRWRDERAHRGAAPAG
jgi:phenylacetate-CoA ligase